LLAGNQGNVKVRIAGGLAEIRTKETLKTSLELCKYISLLDYANKEFEIFRCSGC
jgi:hypothetical protein